MIGLNNNYVCKVCGQRSLPEFLDPINTSYIIFLQTLKTINTAIEPQTTSLAHLFYFLIGHFEISNPYF
jgi:hypothetical protein